MAKVSTGKAEDQTILFSVQPTIHYRIVQNFGGRKLQIWRSQPFRQNII